MLSSSAVNFFTDADDYAAAIRQAAVELTVTGEANPNCGSGGSNATSSLSLKGAQSVADFPISPATSAMPTRSPRTTRRRGGPRTAASS